MIDPWSPTSFTRGRDELREFFVYCVTLSATPPDEAAQRAHKLWNEIGFREAMEDPTIDSRRIQAALVTARTARYQQLRFTYETLAKKFAFDPDWLEKVDVFTLEGLPGVGRFTARYFVLHSRPSQRIAALSARTLWWMQNDGDPEGTYPRVAPRDWREYRRVQDAFVRIADDAGETCAVVDSRAWLMSRETGLSFARGMWSKSGRYASAQESAT